MANLINGKEIAEKLRWQLVEKVEQIKKRGALPKIALINASSDPASEIYIGKKKKLAESIGINSDIYKFDTEVTKEKITEIINKLNIDDNVHAILLQSPLFDWLDFRKLIDLINPLKDVDGLTTVNQGKLFCGERGIVPCTPLGIMHLIHTVHKKLNGMHAVVLGRSTIVGKPVSQLLLKENCTVTILHSKSQNISEICRSADIVVSAIGCPQFITGDFIKPGATVIDVGINRVLDETGKKKIVGDVNFAEVSEIAGALSPVPNGVGPMTVAYLMYNTVNMACDFLGDMS